jgi:nucleotide-binding universal stress UspA family protein
MALHATGGRITVTDSDRVLIWISEGTWQAAVDATLRLAPAAASIILLHVSPAELPGAAHGAYLGLLGRAHPERDPGPRVAELAAKLAGDLLAAAARRLGRPCDQVERQGAAEREVVTAALGAGLLVIARDGDPTRLGPKSLGKAARFVVDHAPCPVLLVWPGTVPATGTIPPPPPGPGHPPHHRPA